MHDPLSAIRHRSQHHSRACAPDHRRQAGRGRGHSNLTGLNSHSAVPGLNREDVYFVSVKLPKREEEKDIAGVLDCLESGIRLEVEALANAQELKRAAMRELFTRGLRGEAQKKTERRTSGLFRFLRPRGGCMSRCAYLFIDEAGNFEFSPKGTRYFVLTSVSVRRPFATHGPLDDYKHDCLEFGLDTEYFHCAEDNPRVRGRVFEVIAAHLDGLRIDSLIVEKRKTGPALREDGRFYPEMLGYLLRFVLKREIETGAEEVIVITDTIPVQKKRRAIEKAVQQALAKMLSPGMRYRILHHASRSHYGLQVADYCCWAVFRKWQKGETEYYDRIEAAVKSEFDIFRTGTRYYY